MAEKIKSQYTDVDRAIEEILGTTRNDLWKAIEEWEYLLNDESLLKRVQRLKKERESADVKIVDYKPKYKRAFKELNEEWIATWFELEEADSKVLDDPENQILKKEAISLLRCINKNP
jgi:hypothetical protein